MYEITELFLNKIGFCLEILLAIHLFGSKMHKRKHFWLRLTLSCLACIGLAIAFPIPPNAYNSLYTSFMFFVIFAICASSMAFVYSIPFNSIFFIAVTSYTTQHISHQLFSLQASAFQIVANGALGMYSNTIIDFSKLDAKFFLQLFVNLESILVTYVAVFFTIGKKINKKTLNINNTPKLIISGIVLLVDIVLNAILVYTKEDYNRLYAIIICIYNLLCCMMVLFILDSLTENKQLKTDLNTTVQLLKKAEQQYEASKENVNLINIKCHDLKHAISRYGENVQIDSSLVDELKNIVNIYDSSAKTNNEALDLILTEKSLLCEKNNIKLNCLADCGNLKHISVTDIYSLFGNLIDNAIEAVMLLSNPEKRSINLIVTNINSFVSINVQNFYEGTIKIGEDGLPLTNKKDKNYHGYGLKSISYIIDKYDGDIDIDTSNHIFKVSILFPLNEDNKATLEDTKSSNQATK